VQDCLGRISVTGGIVEKAIGPLANKYSSCPVVAYHQAAGIAEGEIISRFSNIPTRDIDARLHWDLRGVVETIYRLGRELAPYIWHFYIREAADGSIDRIQIAFERQPEMLVFVPNPDGTWHAFTEPVSERVVPVNLAERITQIPERTWVGYAWDKNVPPLESAPRPTLMQMLKPEPDAEDIVRELISTGVELTRERITVILSSNCLVKALARLTNTTAKAMAKTLFGCPIMFGALDNKAWIKLQTAWEKLSQNKDFSIGLTAEGKIIIRYRHNEDYEVELSFVGTSLFGGLFHAELVIKQNQIVHEDVEICEHLWAGGVISLPVDLTEAISRMNVLPLVYEGESVKYSSVLRNEWGDAKFSLRNSNLVKPTLYYINGAIARLSRDERALLNGIQIVLFMGERDCYSSLSTRQIFINIRHAISSEQLIRILQQEVPKFFDQPPVGQHALATADEL
ncbi:MAG: hypothetical protein PHG68_02775, partial [Candidatus Omnitrophica bacterium]|nr:hypothetical protein [Candidatus Omnitrophota bacterium]